MRQLLLLTIISTVLAGCASALPTCDGSDRRPVNAAPQARFIAHSCGAIA